MRRRVLRVAVVLAAAVPALTAFGCSSADDDPALGATPTAVTQAPALSRPRLCGPLRMTVLGRAAAPAATELSGLVLSSDQPGVLWTHNDSGDRPRIFALRPDGTPLADLAVPGAEAVDWEDLALGPDPARPGGRALYLADIGDNRATRETVTVYRVPEPAASAAATGSTAPAVALTLRYPDGPHDAETLLVDPRTGALVVVTKQLSGESGVYVTRAAPAGPAERTLRAAGTLHLGFGGLATGGDVSADGRVVVVRTYAAAFAWIRRPGASLAGTLRRAPCRAGASLAAEGQGEALALSAHGSAMFTVAEGSASPVRRYAPRPR
ncbi:hypothetical protein FSW04_20760 [Baekduia soli]|uniref:Esterase-like activity of phytase family protein n=1 Tax=Baekduia soli TaxID=496014 RepID=A0A5B8U9M2_9ACTN|nr:hypothetical protein [Baekduia soli]QEC49760.1 hypothetical protein FSW04_20760 [Baekduia soli]